MASGALPIQEWDQPSAEADFEKELMDEDLIEAVHGAMERLTERQQTVLRLAYVDGLSQMEMAAKLNRPLGTIKTWVRSALQALRAEMAPFGARAV